MSLISQLPSPAGILRSVVGMHQLQMLKNTDLAYDHGSRHENCCATILCQLCRRRILGPCGRIAVGIL